MPSDKPSRDFCTRAFAPEPEIKEYFDKQKNSDFNSEVLKHLLEIKTLLKELVKARK